MKRSENEKAIKAAFKGINRDLLAQAMGVSRNIIDQIAAGFVVSPRRAKDVEIYTNGKVTRQILRPDIFC
jgi:DNA-binding transcriptional regulator YdaS (Cro superfamily)